jgi:hypothetical protein
MEGDIDDGEQAPQSYEAAQQSAALELGPGPILVHQISLLGLSYLRKQLSK